MATRGFGHVNLRANADTIEHLRRFYVDIVGLREGPRPVFRSGSRGYWLYASERDVLHLTVARADGSNAQPPGVFNHLAFDCSDLGATRARLDAAGVVYEVDVVDELHQTQLFLTDPAGIGIELTFTLRQA
ncbi:MAG: diguanylate cyclase [Rhodanobacteraceae bacterium]|nr:MAG: diguanylate cyclase [Rhodanobacteraceae bacterium]